MFYRTMSEVFLLGCVIVASSILVIKSALKDDEIDSLLKNIKDAHKRNRDLNIHANHLQHELRERARRLPAASGVSSPTQAHLTCALHGMLRENQATSSTLPQREQSPPPTTPDSSSCDNTQT